jgi:hypothetical protein
VCLDGIDNDGDGIIDYPLEPGCGGPGETTRPTIVISVPASVRTVPMEGTTTSMGIATIPPTRIATLRLGIPRTRWSATTAWTTTATACSIATIPVATWGAASRRTRRPHRRGRRTRRRPVSDRSSAPDWSLDAGGALVAGRAVADTMRRIDRSQRDNPSRRPGAMPSSSGTHGRLINRKFRPPPHPGVCKRSNSNLREMW